MQIDVATISPRDTYELLVRIVTPRPIAWVSTVDSQNRVNLAPFSFFNVFGSNPPVVVFSPSPKRDGSLKDTLINIQQTREFVVNVAVADLAEEMNGTAKELPHGQSEADMVGLEMISSHKVKPPRIRRSPINLECQLKQVIPIGNGPGSANLVIGEIVMIHIDESVVNHEGKIDPKKLRTIGRLGGDGYCHTGDQFELKRPM